MISTMRRLEDTQLTKKEEDLLPFQICAQLNLCLLTLLKLLLDIIRILFNNLWILLRKNGKITHKKRSKHVIVTLKKLCRGLSSMEGNNMTQILIRHNI